jgi:hypothetical protein
MPRWQLTHIREHDFLALIWFRARELGGLSHWIKEASTFEFDFAPIGPRLPAHIGMRCWAAPGDSVEANVWLNIPSSAQRPYLKIGADFEVLPATKPNCLPSLDVVGLGKVKEVHGPNPYYYVADAEIVAEFLPGCEGDFALMGQVFEFHSPELGKTWAGHLDATKRQEGHGWPLTVGNAFLCLHNLLLSDKNPNPGGQPFRIGERFTVLSEGSTVGHVDVLRVINYGKQMVSVCKPTQFTQALRL